MILRVVAYFQTVQDSKPRGPIIKARYDHAPELGWSILWSDLAPSRYEEWERDRPARRAAKQLPVGQLKGPGIP